MSGYTLLITEEERWIPQTGLTTGLSAAFPGTHFTHNRTPHTAFPLTAFIPDPLPGDPDHTLEADLIDIGNCMTFGDASLQKVAEISLWVLDTFPVPTGADVVLQHDDGPRTMPRGVTLEDIVTGFGPHR